MMDIIELNNKSISDTISIIKKRSNTLNIRKSVEDIIGNVKDFGDKALREYTLNFDKVYIENFKVEEEEINKAYNKVDPMISLNGTAFFFTSSSPLSSQTPQEWRRAKTLMMSFIVWGSASLHSTPAPLSSLPCPDLIFLSMSISFCELLQSI